jgi:hypothetical protein
MTERCLPNADAQLHPPITAAVAVKRLQCNLLEMGVQRVIRGSRTGDAIAGFTLNTKP